MGPKDIQFLTMIKKTGVACSFPQEKVRFTLFNGPNVFFIGAGMDYNQYFRDLPHLCSISQSGIQHFKE